MSDNYYPSVQVSERLFLPSAASALGTDTHGAFVGRADQGPTVATRVTSWSNFTTLYGTNYTDLHYAVNDFFANGGRAAYVVRIPGNAAVAASLDVFPSTAANRTGTPLFTATVTNPGAWGNQLRLVTYIRDSVNRRFDAALYRIPAGVTFDATKRNSEYLVDQWVDLTLDPNSPRYFYAVANAPSASGSPIVQFSGQSYDPTLADTPENRPLPGAIGADPTVFTGGVNGTYTSPFDPASAYTSALDALAPVPGPLVLNLPGMTTSSVVRSAIGVAASRGDMFVVADIPANTTPANAVVYVSDLNLPSLGSAAASHCALYYPHVHMPAIGASTPGRTTLRAPGGAVVGLYMAIDALVGPWKAPAGTNTALTGAIAPERMLTSAELTALNNGHVNAIRSIPGAGIVVMGARTLKKSGLDRYVNVRRTVIEITQNLKNSTQFAVFENNDERLWARINAVCSNYLGSVWQSNGLRGATPEEAFFVRCDDTNNSPASIEQGAVNIEVGIAPLSPAEFIVITIGQFDGGSTVAVSI
jgi:uncharacterized protein